MMGRTAPFRGQLNEKRRGQCMFLSSLVPLIRVLDPAPLGATSTIP